MTDERKAMLRGAAAFTTWLLIATALVIAAGSYLPPKSTQLDRIEARLDALQSTADQTVDFLSDLHAEKEKAR